MQKSVIFVNKKFENKYLKIKNIVKLEIIFIIQGNIEVLRIAYVIQNVVCLKKIPIAEEFKKRFTCLGENTENI